ncbi:hypothetical protein AAVH_18683 [Aphelenchoides avenae]|nr:hypothetical protein AAVH_18683 [Aphelenchus avenae]
MTPQGRLYFEFAKKIGDYGGWLISDMSNIRRLYRELMYTAFESMGTICGILDNPAPLVYIGDDIARDAFELYVRLVIHFEYLCHVILLGQAKTDVTFDPGVRIVRQIDSIENWFSGRWKPTTWDAYRRLYREMKPYTGTQPLIEHFPQQMVLFIPFRAVKHSEDSLKDGKSGP